MHCPYFISECTKVKRNVRRHPSLSPVVGTRLSLMLALCTRFSLFLDLLKCIVEQAGCARSLFASDELQGDREVAPAALDTPLHMTKDFFRLRTIFLPLEIAFLRRARSLSCDSQLRCSVPGGGGGGTTMLAAALLSMK